MNKDFIGTFFDPYYSGELWKLLAGTVRDFGNYMIVNFGYIIGLLLIMIAVEGVIKLIEKR